MPEYYIFRTIMYVSGASLFSLLCISTSAFCQPASQASPFPLLKNVGIVVKTHYSFTPPLPPKGWTRDTECIYLVTPDGLVKEQYFCNGGNCDGKTTNEYKDGKLIRMSHYQSPDRHLLFSDHSAYSHPLSSEDYWEYKAGKICYTRHAVGPQRTTTKEARYTYDRAGRVTEEYNNYPKQSLLYYPSHFDEVNYLYDGDTVEKLEYEKGILKDSAVYLERRNTSGQITERLQYSKDGRHYIKELSRYDSSNRIIEYQYFSDMPCVKPDGTVLRADRVEYTYDPLGRPDEVRYFARGIKRWSYKYEYLK